MNDFAVRALFRLRWLYVTRFSWLVGATLISLPCICLLGAPNLLANLFVLDSPVQLFNVSWITLVVAAMVLVTYRVSELNAPERFDDYRRSLRRYLLVLGITRRELEARRRRWKLRWGILWLMWLPIPLASLWATWLDPEPLWDRVPSVQPLDVRVGVIGLVSVAAGAMLGLLLLLLAAFVERNFLAPNAVAKGLLPFEGELWRWDPAACTERRGLFVSRLLARIIARAGPGYVVERREEMSPRAHADAQVALGHSQLALFSGLIVLFYLGNYLLGWIFEVIPGERYPLSALFYLLLTILMFVCIAPGAAFFLDRFRIPVFLGILVTTFTLYLVCETDHFYSVNPRAANRSIRDDAYQPPEIVDTFANWEFPPGRDGHRTLVVVNASGGGIQASAWTAQVLTGLDELYGAEFSRSIGLISGVSGGSVGTMYYLINRPEFTGPVTTSRRPLLRHAVARRIRELAQASALEATSWGFAYPDLMRAIFPPLTSRTVDRGWSVEQIWRQRMNAGWAGGEDRSDVRLSDLGERVLRNQLPVVAFNATLVETGQRLVLSPVVGRGLTDAAGLHDAQEFFALYGPQAHLRVSTAVRLSATFPYVSPVCRPIAPPTQPLPDATSADWHAADGAYSDNEGVVTSVDWINRLLDHYHSEARLHDRPFDRILLIRIQPFPTTAPGTQSSRGQGWVNAWFGPLKAIMRVRSASQMERGNIEVRLLSKATAAESAMRMERLQASERVADEWVERLERERSAIAPRMTGNSSLPLAERAEVAGKFNAASQQLQSAREQAELIRRRRRRTKEIQVTSIRFICQPPNDRPGPLSWKLTASQKQAIQAAWEKVVAGDGEEQPLAVLDRLFQRLPPRP